VIDPGIGFGKDLHGNLTLLRSLAEFKSLGVPVLLGTSRKAFIGRILGREVHERLHGTAATVAFGIMQGATIFRVHDVRAMRDVADMTATLTGRWSGLDDPT
jgi:dihydropteroate synthase